MRAHTKYLWTELVSCYNDISLSQLIEVCNSMYTVGQHSMIARHTDIVWLCCSYFKLIYPSEITEPLVNTFGIVCTVC